MRRKWVILPMISSWFIFIALDSVLGIFRTGYARNTKKPIKLAILIVNYLRSGTIFIIAILNFILAVSFSKHNTGSSVRNNK